MVKNRAEQYKSHSSLLNFLCPSVPSSQFKYSPHHVPSTTIKPNSSLEVKDPCLMTGSMLVLQWEDETL
jgi:hypothetical protein